MRLHEARKDLYRRLAKEQGYKSRAAFKLLEACERFAFIGEGDKVIDFGAAPGGWLQVAAKLVGPTGLVVGVDKHKVAVKGASVKTLEVDVFDPGLPERLTTLLAGKSDVVLSDLAPSVSGVWELDQTIQVELTLRVLTLSTSVLKISGSAFFKLFEGERSGEVRSAFKNSFKSVHPMKPAASRSASSELYYFCEGWRGNAEAHPAAD